MAWRQAAHRYMATCALGRRMQRPAEAPHEGSEVEGFDEARAHTHQLAAALETPKPG